MVAGATPIYELWPFCFLLLLSRAFFLFKDQTPQYAPILLNTIKISPFQNKTLYRCWLDSVPAPPASSGIQFVMYFLNCFLLLSF